MDYLSNYRMPYTDAMLLSHFDAYYKSFGYVQLNKSSQYIIIDTVYSYIEQCYYKLYKPIYTVFQDQDIYYVCNENSNYGMKIFLNVPNQLFVNILLHEYDRFLIYPILTYIEYNICKPIIDRKIATMNNISNKYNQLQTSYNQLQNNNKSLQTKINSTEVAKSQLEYALLHTKDNLIDCMEEIDH